MSATVLELGQALTPKEVEVAHRYLSATRNAVVRAVSGISHEQAAFAPAPGRWSIADVVEHLNLLEDLFVNRIVGRLLETPNLATIEDAVAQDARVIGLERNPRSTVVAAGRASLADAPAPTRPTQRWPLDESLARFVRNRERTIRVLQSVPDLRDHAVEHLGLGPLDGYQWLLFIAAHTERHLRQIEALKADPQFPLGPEASGSRLEEAWVSRHR